MIRGVERFQFAKRIFQTENKKEFKKQKKKKQNKLN